MKILRIVKKSKRVHKIKKSSILNETFSIHKIMKNL